MAVALLAACGSSSSSDAPDAAPAIDAGDADARPAPDARPGTSPVFGGARPAALTVPAGYDPATPTPLVVVLHGRFTSPDYIVPILQLDRLSTVHGALLIAPDGTSDPSGNYFWNATDACCDLYDQGPDDVAYLTSLIAEVRAAYNVDPARIYLIGHSNGAFMSLRLACEHADVFAAVVSIAGANALDPAACQPSKPVSVLQLHGDRDETILYAGGALTQRNGDVAPYPSAQATVEAWARLDGCGALTGAETAVNLDRTAGDETTRVRAIDCPAGVDAELWTTVGGPHLPSFSSDAPTALWTWLAAHPKAP
jgi:polyhydroxybutyrate depolymerase